MKPPDYTYKLDKAQYHKAQTIIREEQKDILPRWQQRAYLTFNISVYGFVIMFIIYILASILAKGNVNAFITILFAINLILTAALIVSLILNIPLFKKLRKRIRVLRRIGSYKLSRAAREKETGFKRFISLSTRFTFIIGILIMFFASIGIFFYLVAYFSNDESQILKELLWVATGFIISVLIGVSLIMNHYLRLHKKRLKKVAELEASLKQGDESTFMESEYFDLPKQKYDEIVQLEQEQISYSRMKTLLSIKSEDLESFAIQKSKKVQQVISSLDANTSLAIADQLNEMAMDPEMEGIYTDAGTKISHLVLPGTRYKIDFMIDKDKKNIHIFNLEKQ